MKRHIEAFAKYGGVVAVSFEWLALFIFYVQNPSDFSGQHPISYFATLSQTRLVFSICYTIAALSFWIFTKFHLNKHYRAPVKMFTLSMLGFAGVALVPFSFTNPVSSTIHSVLALSFSLTFGAGMYLIAKHNDDRHIRRASTVAVMLGALFLISYLLARQDSHLTLIFESGSGLACQLWIIWMSYYTYRR